MTSSRTRASCPTASPSAGRSGGSWSSASPHQLGSLDIGFTQLAALYAVAGPETLTVGDLAEQLDRSPSATSRLVGGLVERGYLERSEEVVDRRQRVLTLTVDGPGRLLSAVDHDRADQFLAVVRPMPMAERALVAMGVAALANHAMTQRGGLRRDAARQRLSRTPASRRARLRSTAASL